MIFKSAALLEHLKEHPIMEDTAVPARLSYYRGDFSTPYLFQPNDGLALSL